MVMRSGNDDEWDEYEDDEDEERGRGSLRLNKPNMDALINPSSAMNAPQQEEPPEEPQEEPQEESSDGITIDENGTEWYEDEVGVWWYREQGMDDWAEFHEQ